MYLPSGGVDMTFKKIVRTYIALIIMAALAAAMVGCDDLGAYEDTEEYYSSFGDIVLVSGTTKEREEYSVEKYFYNEESRENFLAEEDGAYKGVDHSDYVYMAIPLESSMDMDSIALYIQSKNDVTVYINVFVTDKIPTEWKSIADNVINGGEGGGSSDEEDGNETEKVYDDPAYETRVGETAVHLKNGKWGSFVLDDFNVNGKAQKSIEIKEGQYILLQIRNNSGVRVFDDEKKAYVDPQTGLELQKAEITMTNLLVRALEIKNVDESQGG
jgi:hypothetical protein